MSSIKSLEQLINHFEDEPPSRRAKILDEAQIPIGDFMKYASWKEDCYTRNCIARTEEFEFILICWDLNAITPIHGHDDKDCWMYQIEGELKEKVLTETEHGFELVSENKLTESTVSFMHDTMGYHTLSNNGDKRAMSLHIYAAPIDKCLVYSDNASRFETVELSYDRDHS